MRRTIWVAILMVSPVLLAAEGSKATGTWKIDGEVQGTPVKLTCELAEAEHKLTGSCTGVGPTARTVAGEVKEGVVSWHFDSEYQGQPITVSLVGTLAEDGAKMTGTMYVAPMGVDGTFSAAKQKDPPAEKDKPAE